jgi:UDP-N-acetylglucosamine:LPS N-acetylglucosamine transferase
MPKKKVLIFTARFGDGHDAVARNIRDALESLDRQDVEVKIIDLYAQCYNLIYKLEQKIYLTLINSTPALWNMFYKFSDATHIVEYSLFTRHALRRALAATLEKEQPDAVVTTYWMYTYLFGSLFNKSAQQRRFAWIGIVPETITIHSAYWRGGSDAFVAADETSAGVLQRAGVAASKVKAIGYPVSPRFAGLKDRREPLSRVAFCIFSRKFSSRPTTIVSSIPAQSASCRTIAVACFLPELIT